MNNTYKCPKCNGTGNLPRYAGIANGVCFSCEGNGFKVGVQTEKARKWTVYGALRATGEKAVAYIVTAKSADLAAKKALATFAKASAAYQERFDMSNLEVVA